MEDLQRGRCHLRVIKRRRPKISARPLEDTQEMLRCFATVPATNSRNQTALCPVYSSEVPLKVLQHPWWQNVELFLMM